MHVQRCISFILASLVWTSTGQLSCDENEDHGCALQEDHVSALQVKLIRHRQNSSDLKDGEQLSDTGESHLVSAEELKELHQLCHEVGLQRACANLSKLSAGGNRDDAAASLPCQDVGDTRILFAHVMKTAGESVDEYLKCRCTHEGCAVQLHDHAHKTVGNKQCDTSLCALHGKILNASDRCGDRYEKLTARFTVLRDPVSRVWSFYNYLSRWYIPYQQRTLVSILEKYGEEDLNEGLADSEQCEHCHKELVNRMVLGNFCGNYALCSSLEEGPQTDERALAEATAAAMKVLGNFDAVFFQSDLGDFVAEFENVSKIFPTTAANASFPVNPAGCLLPEDKNPTIYRWGALDNVTAKLIREKNWADVLLYQYAADKWHMGELNLEGTRITVIDGSTGSISLFVKVALIVTVVAAFLALVWLDSKMQGPGGEANLPEKVQDAK
mmetsp:Transcript_16422/g.30233  ORF Transcript_16422/g.30233 Transcript_16422/m.30233 type:complete len:442 (-) Transcript_16422:54-1379(-)